MAEFIAGMLGIAVGFIVLLVLFVVVIYNKLVSLRNTAQSSWSDIDVHLKKRYDLVPNLVENSQRLRFPRKNGVRKGYRGPFHGDPGVLSCGKGQDRKIFFSIPEKPFAVAEAYPELKANANFIQLQSQLKGAGRQYRIRKKVLQCGRPRLQHPHRVLSL